MKKITAVVTVLVLVLSLACAFAENTMGGWQAAEDPTIFDKGLEGLVGVGYKPVAYLGSQVVAGTNHAVLCQGTVVVPDAVPSWKIVYLYQDLQGNVSVLDIEDFDFGALCSYGAEK